jgi:hypothetical protein
MSVHLNSFTLFMLWAHFIALEHFIFQPYSQGFTQASPRFSTVDTGYGFEALDAKIQGGFGLTVTLQRLALSPAEYLQTFTYLPQTLRVFFGGLFRYIHIIDTST